MSHPDPKRSTRGNRRVPLSGTQFPELHSRARKANDIELILHLINYPKDLVYALKRILPKIRQNPIYNTGIPLPKENNL